MIGIRLTYLRFILLHKTITKIVQPKFKIFKISSPKRFLYIFFFIHIVINTFKKYIFIFYTSRYIASFPEIKTNAGTYVILRSQF